MTQNIAWLHVSSWQSWVVEARRAYECLLDGEINGHNLSQRLFHDHRRWSLRLMSRVTVIYNHMRQRQDNHLLLLFCHRDGQNTYVCTYDDGDVGNARPEYPPGMFLCLGLLVPQSFQQEDENLMGRDCPTESNLLRHRGSIYFLHTKKNLWSTWWSKVHR
jgi:hypothetical protein